MVGPPPPPESALRRRKRPGRWCGVAGVLPAVALDSAPSGWGGECLWTLEQMTECPGNILRVQNWVGGQPSRVNGSKSVRSVFRSEPDTAIRFGTA